MARYTIGETYTKTRRDLAIARGQLPPRGKPRRPGRVTSFVAWVLMLTFFAAMITGILWEISSGMPNR